MSPTLEIGRSVLSSNTSCENCIFKVKLLLSFIYFFAYDISGFGKLGCDDLDP